MLLVDCKWMISRNWKRGKSIHTLGAVHTIKLRYASVFSDKSTFWLGSHIILYPVNNFFLKLLLLTVLLLRLCVGTQESLSTRGGQGADWETGFLCPVWVGQKKHFYSRRHLYGLLHNFMLAVCYSLTFEMLMDKVKD